MKTIKLIFKQTFLATLFFFAMAASAIAGPQITKVAVSKTAAIQAIAQYKAQGYIPTWIDGFNHNTSVALNTGKETLFNLVFDKNNNNAKFNAFIGMSGSSYQAKFNHYVGVKKMKLTFVESYKDAAGTIRYAAVFVKKSGPTFTAYHGKLQAAHQAKFNQLTSQGYRLVCRSTVQKNGNSYVTALYDKKNVGSWVAKSYKSLGQTQSLMESNKAAGRTLNHFDVLQKGNSTTDINYSMIFDSQPNNGWYAKNGLSKNQLSSEIMKAKRKGYETTIISGYDKAASLNGNEYYKLQFAVCFVKPTGIGGFVINP